MGKQQRICNFCGKGEFIRKPYAMGKLQEKIYKCNYCNKIITLEPSAKRRSSDNRRRLKY